MTRAAASLVLVLVALTGVASVVSWFEPQLLLCLAGWGDQLIWAQTYEEALSLSRSRNKPLIVLFHLEDCPHSQALKQAFANDDEIQRTLDEDFVVLNLMVGCRAGGGEL
uniref:Anterior gradient 2 n=1 Tax=Salarias fasciatus TaxID=181472 RepID=A0A672HLV0_SALFA